VIEIIDETRQCPSLELLEKTLQAYLHELAIKQWITLVICDDATIQVLNKEHRGEAAPTDVLSYPLAEPDDANMPVVEQLGDVFISLDTARRQAQTHNHSLMEELLTLAAHGITHLRGFDHETETAWTRFHQEQKRILTFLERY
jgi:probable rRNA maturation factor